MAFKLVTIGAFDEKGVSQLLRAPGERGNPACSGTRNLQDNLSDLRAQVRCVLVVVMWNSSSGLIAVSSPGAAVHRGTASSLLLAFCFHDRLRCAVRRNSCDACLLFKWGGVHWFYVFFFTRAAVVKPKAPFFFCSRQLFSGAC